MIVVKNEIRARARLTNGILNILKDDVDMINIDIDNLNLYTIEESVSEAMCTIMDLIENLIAIENCVLKLKEPKK